MTYTEAKAKLVELAGERYCSLQVSYSRHSAECGGEEIFAAQMYIEGAGWTERHRTYEGAFDGISELVAVNEDPAGYAFEMQVGVPELTAPLSDLRAESCGGAL